MIDSLALGAQNTSARLQFSPTAITLSLSVASIVCVLILGWLAWKRSGYRSSVLCLELLRTLIVIGLIFVLNQPESVRRFVPEEKSTLAVLVDQSHSMETPDVYFGDNRSVPPMSRSDATAPLLAEEADALFGDALEVVVTPFGHLQGGKETDIHQALTEAHRAHPGLKAIVLASDGDWNTGSPPVEAAIELRANQIPIFAIPLGSSSVLPDVELTSFNVPTFGVEGKSVRIPFTVDSSLTRDFLAQLELRSSDGTTIKHPVEIKAMGRTSDAIIWKPVGSGDYTLELVIPEHPDEVVADNNSLEAPIAIRQEKLKVLVIESLPRWEYRFLRNALSRDPGVELHCLLFHPGLDKVGGGSKDYLPSFPDSLDELAQYDVVILGDVGLEIGQLNFEQCQLLVGLVQQQASGLVFIPGPKGFQLSLINSPLAPLLPVLYDTSQPRGWGMRTPSHLVLTELGRNSLLTRLLDSVDENTQLWEGLPGFQWHAAVLRAKAGSDVLAVHHESSNQYGRIPLLVTRTFGSGKILLMATDGAWRWRRGVEDLYHYRFWGQVVRWMAYQRNMAKGESMRLYYTPEQPQVRQTVALNANVMSPGGEPLSQADVSLKIVAPSGRIQQVQMLSTGNQWGAFAGSFVPDESGEHQLKLMCRESATQLEAKVFVQGRNREPIGRPVRLDVMEELARVTRGQVIRSDQLSTLSAAIQSISKPPEVIQRVALWSHPWVAAILITALAIFWIGRKAIGVV